MLAYKCNNCKQYFTGGPRFVVRPQLLTLADPEELDFCTWDCVSKYAWYRHRKIKIKGGEEPIE